LQTSLRLTEESLKDAKELGSLIQIFLALWQMVCVAGLQRDAENAHKYVREAWAMARGAGASLGFLLALIVSALQECFVGEAGRGVRLAAAALALSRERGMILGEAEGEPVTYVFNQALMSARSRLTAGAFEAAQQEGSRLTLERAIALASETVGREEDEA
jgi:hypothetical protein